MSTCISRHGEYSDHEPGDYCDRCGAFNESRVVGERDHLLDRIAAAEKLHAPVRWYTDPCDHDCDCIKAGPMGDLYGPDAYEFVCGRCSGDVECAEAYLHLVYAPCPTIKALRGES